MENMVIKANITATSDKQNPDKRKRQQVPTKTAYISTDEANTRKLEDFGLTRYTSKDGNEFFAIKFVAEPKFYQSNEPDETPRDWSAVVQTDLGHNNFEFYNVQLNILKAENAGNEFFRIQAIKGDETDYREVKPENPFA